MGCFAKELLLQSPVHNSSEILQGFDKGTATEHASLSCATVNSLVTDLDTFHILTADIQDAVYFRIKESSCVIMGNGFDFTFVKKKCRFDQGFAVTGGAGKSNFCIFRKKAVNLLDGVDGGFQRVSVVTAVKE